MWKNLITTCYLMGTSLDVAKLAKRNTHSCNLPDWNGGCDIV